ncbi:uncharacterized protein LOC116172334 [Photinus pyralis]|nr:uncharacterized protein LOC116172334 [Photinus pyralis]
MGLPAPPKQKGIQHAFYLEVALPLLDQAACSSKSPPVTKPPEGVSYKSHYERPDEYKREKELNTPEASFKTSRKEWAKIIQFPEESISAPCPEQELTLIRDTFRSKVNVKVIYLMVRPPVVPKGKPPATPPHEEIMKKITLANVTCELRAVNWSDKTIDFYWADHDACHLQAIPVEGSLRSITYVEGKPPAKARAVDDANVEYLPSVLTVQVGFGLKRLESNAQR